MIRNFPASIHSSEENNPFYTCSPWLRFRDIQNIRKRSVSRRAAGGYINLPREESPNAVPYEDNVTIALITPFSIDFAEQA
jgi:hypothetical protein